MTSSVGHLAPIPWCFDEAVADCFDDMLARSIPTIDALRAETLAIGAPFVHRGTEVLDLGASRGGAVAPFVDRFGAAVRFRLWEASPPMADAAERRFRGYVDAGVLRVLRGDVAGDDPLGAGASLALAVFTFQFLPVEDRPRVLARVAEALLPGGALILAEKVLPPGARTGEALHLRHEAAKREAGYSADEIERKRLALRGVLVPLAPRWTEDLVLASGFAEIEPFWAWGPFRAWIAIRK